ncbi:MULTISPECIES: lysophospholipid acyltransferase family protein [unclassified Embleya]|uniref:lysophospholipid acyltransferase family protein n=1 Tax=unclassified Embleya TaxID=2699296 RepID=UPI003407FC84
MFPDLTHSHGGSVLIDKFMHGVVAPTAKAIYRPRTEGRENVPMTGPVIIASNHLSFVDSVAIPVVMPRKVSFLAKAEYFDGPGLKGRVSKSFFTGIGAVAVPRGAHSAAKAALETALSVLERGDAFGIYPEGTRSRDGRLYRGRTGVAWLALAARCPVVPVGIIDTDRVQPIGSNIPRLSPRALIRFGEPLDFSHHYERKDVARARREITDEIMEAIQKLSGQDYAGVYNETAAEV